MELKNPKQQTVEKLSKYYSKNVEAIGLYTFVGTF